MDETKIDENDVAKSSCISRISRGVHNLNSTAEYHRADRQVLIDVNMLDIKGFSIDKPHSFIFLGDDFANDCGGRFLLIKRLLMSHYNNPVAPRASM